VFRSNELCLACHSKPGLAKNAAAGEQALETIDPQVFAASAHAKTPCTQCHASQAAIPHPGTAPGQVAATIDEMAICSSCHRDAYEGYSHTAHGIVGNLGDSRAPGCTDCHSAHDVTRVSDWKSDQRGQACARCHAGAGGAFAEASIGHREPSASWFAPSYFAGRFLVVLMASVLAFGILHVELDMLRWGVARARSHRTREEDE